MSRAGGEALSVSVHWLAAAAAVPAGFLPRRHWGRWPSLPIRGTAVASALLSFVLGFAFGVPGFLRYAGRVADAANVRMLEVAAEQMAHPRAGERAMDSGAPMLIGFFSAAAFAFLTPLGWLSTYLAGAGFVRALRVAGDDPAGDPLLEVADAAASRLRRRVRAGREAAHRERLEGPEVADVLVTGRVGACPGADYVLVGSRRKPGWEPGAFVVTSGPWYRVGEPFERRRPGGLRYFYPLIEVRDLEVLRRGVVYELPHLSEALS